MRVPGVTAIIHLARGARRHDEKTSPRIEPLCANGCGRPTLERAKFCLACVSGNTPLPCPALVPTDYLAACSLELAARGEARFSVGGAVQAEQADRLWWMIIARKMGVAAP